MKAKLARVDADKSATGLTRIIHHPASGQCVGPGTALINPEYEAEDGSRIPLHSEMSDVERVLRIAAIQLAWPVMTQERVMTIPIVDIACAISERDEGRRAWHRLAERIIGRRSQ